MSEEVQKIIDDATLLQTKKSWKQALSLLDKVALDATAPKEMVRIAQLEKSVCLHALKKWKEAIDVFSNLNSHTKIKAKYYFILGDCRKFSSDFEGAKNDYYTALWKAPLNDKYLKSYADIMGSDEDILLRKLRQIADLKPLEAIKIRAFIAKKIIKQNRSAGFVDLLEASSVHIDDLNALYCLADVFFHAKEYRSAYSILNKIISLKTSTFPLMWNYRYSDISYEIGDGYKYLDIEKSYNFHLDIKDIPSETLIIVISSVENKFILAGFNFYADVLYISEKQMNYFVYNFLGLCEFVENIIIEHNYKNVKFVGLSKAGFAAINLAMRISEKISTVNFSVAAFSPQTQLFPFNENLNSLPSYVNLLKRCNQYNVLDFSLKKYGNLFEGRKGVSSNLAIHIIYGALQKKDKKEVLKIGGVEGIFFHPISDYPFHNTLLLFVKKNDALRSGISKLFLTTDGDNAFFMADQKFDSNIDKFIGEDYYSKMELNSFLESI